MTPEEREAELRKRSGHVSTAEPIAVFLYLLMRDHFPAGAVEAAVQDALEPAVTEATDGRMADFANGWLGAYAMNLSRRLRKGA